MLQFSILNDVRKQLDPLLGTLTRLLRSWVKYSPTPSPAKANQVNSREPENMDLELHTHTVF